MGSASIVCGNLRTRLWNNRHVSIKFKCQVYLVNVLAALLYGAETWTIYNVETERLPACDETPTINHGHIIEGQDHQC